MSIKVENVRKQFGDFVALDDVSISFLPVDCFHEHGDPQDVREQDEFLPDIRTGLPSFRKKVNGLVPLLDGRGDLLDERVKMGSQTAQDLSQPFVWRLRPTL